jgi:hypothetical protein
MRTRIVVVAAAVLALGARAGADDAHKGATGGSRDGGTASGAGAEQGGGVPSQSRDVKSTPGGKGEAGSLPDKDPAAKAEAAPELQSVVGTVVKLEGDSLTVKSSPLSDPHEVSLGDATKFTREGESISRDQIQEGDQVRATFAGKGGTASEIAVIRKGEGGAGATQPGQSTGGQERDTGMEKGQKAAPTPGGGSGSR